MPEVVVSTGVKPMGITEGPYNGKPNPHAWMSAENALIYVDNIRDALVKYDPDNAQIYKQNAERYKAKIRQMADPLRAELEKFPPINAGWSPVKARSLTWRAITT